MAVTVEGKKQLRWCADRALLEYDHGGGADAALNSVISDFTKSDITATISPFVVMMVVGEAVVKGRDELEKAIMGFNI